MLSLLSSSSSARSDICRTRSMTRASRVDVESTSVPHAEMSTAGVIIAVRTAIADDGALKEVSQSMEGSPRKQPFEVAAEDERAVFDAGAQRRDKAVLLGVDGLLPPSREEGGIG